MKRGRTGGKRGGEGRREVKDGQRKPQQRDENRIETALAYEILLTVPELIIRCHVDA